MSDRDTDPKFAPARNLGQIDIHADGPDPEPGSADGQGWGLRRKGYLSPGARKEKLRQRRYRAPTRRSPQPPRPWTELRACSSFSFLRGASLPEDLIEAAAAAELPSMALLDRGGVYGAPRFYKAARQAGIRAQVGAEVVVAGEPFIHGDASDARAFVPADAEETRLVLLVGDRNGYRNLCRMLTAGALDRPKGEAQVDVETVAAHAQGLHCLAGSDQDPVARALAREGFAAARHVLERLSDLFPGRLHVELQRHGLRNEEHKNRALIDLARRLQLPIVATNGARYAHRSDKPLHDVMTCIRHHTHLDGAGALLAAERERHVVGAAAMQKRFADLPRALSNAWELSQQLDFTLADLGYRFPDSPLPPGETPSSYLRALTWNGARARFRPLTTKAQRQIERELAMIEKLDLAGYFLIVHDIVRFCIENRILAQGRGSAANSAVCYALSITAIDPVKMELLFERFLSEERGEWPDIDLDLPSGDQRERVIQYVYQRYGPHGAAMTANVITYRDRMAAREVAKALGYSAAQVDRLSKQLGSWSYDIKRGDPKGMATELEAAGFDSGDSRIRLFADMWQRIQNHPRHLGQHSGGMVMAAGRLDDVVPLEPAAMADRVVVQWDKDDCADLGIIKVDLLGLGMLNALEEAVPLIHEKERLHVDLAHLPPDDPDTYAMLQRADTVGVFQVESRAQMASLPRNRPERFYDLVIQVAIIRPGPIVGNMAHPFFERRMGREEVSYFHPCLEPILKRTLGVPIFQEQILRMAMEAAGFSGGEAEELRRAMGFKRSMERMEAIERRLREGMTVRGITGEAQERIVEGITSFALYGFPESHAASFALIAYASAYLKCHHPTAFFLSLLNAWPMGFYHPASLVQQAQRQGTAVLPIDVAHSDQRCTWQDTPDSWRKQSIRNGLPVAAGAIRLGLRYVKELRSESGERIEHERERAPFRDVEDLVRRCELRKDEAERLAWVGALASLGSTACGKRRRELQRREALWQVARATRTRGPLFAELSDETPSPLQEMDPLELAMADFRGTEITTGPHPVTFYRKALDGYGVVRTAELDRWPEHRRVRTAGSVIVRQRPGTAKGLLFLTLEDETGMAQAVVMPDVMREHRELIVRSAGLIVEGELQKRDGSLSVKADRFWPLESLERIPSHDFR